MSSSYEIFSCCEELKSALKRFIDFIFLKSVSKVSLYIVDETAQEDELEKFWNKFPESKNNEIFLLFLTFPDLDSPGVLKFIKNTELKWTEWQLVSDVPLKSVLEKVFG